MYYEGPYARKHLLPSLAFTCIGEPELVLQCFRSEANVMRNVPFVIDNVAREVALNR